MPFHTFKIDPGFDPRLPKGGTIRVDMPKDLDITQQAKVLDDYLTNKYGPKEYAIPDLPGPPKVNAPVTQENNPVASAYPALGLSPKLYLALEAMHRGATAPTYQPQGSDIDRAFGGIRDALFNKQTAVQFGANLAKKPKAGMAAAIGLPTALGLLSGRVKPGVEPIAEDLANNIESPISGTIQALRSGDYPGAFGNLTGLGIGASPKTAALFRGAVKGARGEGSAAPNESLTYMPEPGPIEEPQMGSPGANPQTGTAGRTLGSIGAAIGALTAAMTGSSTFGGSRAGYHIGQAIPEIPGFLGRMARGAATEVSQAPWLPFDDYSPEKKPQIVPSREMPQFSGRLPVMPPRATTAPGALRQPAQGSTYNPNAMDIPFTDVPVQGPIPDIRPTAGPIPETGYGPENPNAQYPEPFIGPEQQIDVVRRLMQQQPQLGYQGISPGPEMPENPMAANGTQRLLPPVQPPNPPQGFQGQLPTPPEPTPIRQLIEAPPTKYVDPEGKVYNSLQESQKLLPGQSAPVQPPAGFRPLPTPPPNYPPQPPPQLEQGPSFFTDPMGTTYPYQPPTPGVVYNPGARAPFYPAAANQPTAPVPDVQVAPAAQPKPTPQPPEPKPTAPTPKPQQQAKPSVPKPTQQQQQPKPAAPKSEPKPEPKPEPEQTGPAPKPLTDITPETLAKISKFVKTRVDGFTADHIADKFALSMDQVKPLLAEMIADDAVYRVGKTRYYKPGKAPAETEAPKARPVNPPIKPKSPLQSAKPDVPKVNATAKPASLGKEGITVFSPEQLAEMAKKKKGAK